MVNASGRKKLANNLQTAAICRYQWKQSCRYTLLLAPVSSPVFASFLPVSLACYSWLLRPGEILSRIPARVFPNRIHRHAAFSSPSASAHCAASGNYCFSRIPLFWHFCNSSRVYGPLEWLQPASSPPRYLVSLRFTTRHRMHGSTSGGIVFRNAGTCCETSCVRGTGSKPNGRVPKKRLVPIFLFGVYQRPRESSCLISSFHEDATTLAVSRWVVL